MRLQRKGLGEEEKKEKNKKTIDAVFAGLMISFEAKLELWPRLDGAGAGGLPPRRRGPRGRWAVGTRDGEG